MHPPLLPTFPGGGLLWNWLITPSGARLLWKDEDTDCCCLDRLGVVPSLSCIDGRWGDHYPCSRPFTIRKIATPAKSEINYRSGETTDRHRQHLQIIRVRPAHPDTSGITR